MDIAADLYGLLDVELEEMVELISELPETAVLNLLNATRPLSNTATPKGPLEMAQELDAGYRSRPHLTYLSERLAQAVTDVENGKSRFIRICMPPRMGKSLLSSVYLPAWLLRKHPEWKVGLVSHSPTLSVSWARAVRRMVEEFGPDWDVGIARDAGAVSDWETTKGGEVHSRSAPGQSLTGMGFNVMLLDDLVKDSASAHSKVQRDTLWEWWLSNALSRLEPPSLVVAIGTRWHEDDLLGRLLSTEYDGDPGEWEVIEFPALAEDHDVLGRSPGEPLYSPLLDETPEQACERWEKLKAAVGSYSWSALYQQHPSPAKGAIFDTNSWRYWTHNPNHATDDGVVVYIPPGLLESGRWLDSWDMSFKGTETSDWVVAQRWCRQGPNRYLVHQEKGRWSFTQALGKMEEWITPASPYGTLVHQRLVEDTANGPAIMDVMKKKVAGIKAISPKTSKEARARAVTPECESGHVYLPFPGDPGNEWVLGLISELRNFPLDANDDQVDAFTQALGELRDAGMGLITVPGQGAALGIRQLPTPRGPYAQNVKRPAAASMRQRIRRA